MPRKIVKKLVARPVKSGGENTLKGKRTRRVFTEEFRREAVAMLLDWHAAGSVAERLGLASSNVLYRWKVAQLKESGPMAGSQSRATDTHLILRPHEENDCVVLDAVVRSRPPILPRVLRWTFPDWTRDDTLDPTALRPDRPRRKAKTNSESDSPPKATEPLWNALRFAEEFVTETPIPKVALVEAATTAGLSERKANKLLRQAEVSGLIHRWKYGSNLPIRFAKVPQLETVS